MLRSQFNLIFFALKLHANSFIIFRMRMCLRQLVANSNILLENQEKSFDF
jgi:hypothetical protein